jgi:hypothetical protein
MATNCSISSPAPAQSVAPSSMSAKIRTRLISAGTKVDLAEISAEAPLVFFHKHAYNELMTKEYTPTLNTDPRLDSFKQMVDTSRLVRTYIDMRARTIGTTRAQWALLARLARQPGLADTSG